MPFRRLAAASAAGALALAVAACSAGGPPSAGAGDNASASAGGSPAAGLFGGFGGDTDVETSAGGSGGGSNGGESNGGPGGDGQSGASHAPESSAGPSPAAPVTRTIGKSVLFAGFKITVKTAAYVPAPDGSSGEVTLDTVFANQGSSRGDTEYTAQTVDLASGDHHYRVRGDSDFPTVPGQTRGEGDLLFDVDEHFSLDTAVLTIGSAAQVQSVMPLGSDGTLVANTPQKAAVSGSAPSGAVTVAVTGGQLRADLPKVLTQAQQGTRYLLLSFDETNNSKRPSPYGNYVSGFSNFTLTTPDGNTITAYSSDDYYGAAPTTTVLTGKTAHGLLVVFVIKTPVAGTYTFTFVGEKDDGSGDDAAPGSFDFTLG